MFWKLRDIISNTEAQTRKQKSILSIFFISFKQEKLNFLIHQAAVFKSNIYKIKKKKEIINIHNKRFTVIFKLLN